EGRGAPVGGARTHGMNAMVVKRDYTGGDAKRPPPHAYVAPCPKSNLFGTSIFVNDSEMHLSSDDTWCHHASGRKIVSPGSTTTSSTFTLAACGKRARSSDSKSTGLKTSKSLYRLGPDSGETKRQRL